MQRRPTADIRLRTPPKVRTRNVTWEQFKRAIAPTLESNGAWFFRGQRDSKWRLQTSLHRTTIVRNIPELKRYFEVVVPKVHDALEAWTGKAWNYSHPLGLAELLAFLQHNGFPTPLLDWSLSPYVAAYFAYEGINHFAPQSDRVSIYSFHATAWQGCFRQATDVGDPTPHVSILTPRMVGNHKLALQQGCFTWSNLPDVETHIRLNEAREQRFLTKYNLPTSERPRVMAELKLMGITAVNLMPSVESVCKKALEDLIGLAPIEKGT